MLKIFFLKEIWDDRNSDDDEHGDDNNDDMNICVPDTGIPIAAFRASNRQV